MSEWVWNQDFSKKIFEKKYMLHGEESVEEVIRQISDEIASVENEDIREEIAETFYNEIYKGKFLPAGRIMANARPYSKLKNYLNCFVIDIEDSMEGIYDALKEDATISKMGGGVGFNISKLRPKESSLSKGGTASGPVSFLKVFDKSASVIHTGGSRRAAHIAILNVNHPDIEEFITCKQGDENKELTQFNISVGITDDFIKAVKKDEDWNLVWNGKVYKTLKAKKLYNKMVKNAYLYNEPGIFNLDIVNRYSNAHYLYKINSPNPCGEQPLPSYGVCDLGAVNFTQFVVKPFEDDASIDWPNLRKTIHTGVRFLDNVLDLTDYPLEKIETRALNERRIGLGFTGLGDTLAMLKIKYGSEESKKFINKLMRFFRDESYIKSIELSQEKGWFPLFDPDNFLNSEFIKNLSNEIQDSIKKNGIRNVCINTIAPTGTISTSLGQNCSSGIEPIFALDYIRNVREGNDGKTIKEKVFDYAYMVYREKYSTEDIPEYFVTSMEVNPKDAIDIQSICQKYIDASISKTLNIPQDYSFKEYENLFMYAYEQNLKGFTSFRIGSMQGILELKNGNGRPQYIERQDAPSRPKELPCDIHEISVNKEKHIVLVGKLQGTLYEIFVTNDKKNKIDPIKYKFGLIRKVKKGQYSLIVENGEEKIVIDDISETFDNVYSSLSRFISMSLRHGVSLQFIVEQLSKDKNFVGFEKSVGRVLKKYIKSGEKVETSDSCPSCKGSTLIYEEGCKKCTQCGWTACN